MRALPPQVLARPYHVYEVLQPLGVTAGRTRPGFGQIGFGMQYELPTSIEELIASGHLRRVW
jgi:hypothetical protein